MTRSLNHALNDILMFAYPETWHPAWLSLPLTISAQRSPYRFQVICSDLPALQQGRSAWPPISRHPNVWLRWAPTPGAGFWIRPRRFDPILRGRFVLVEPAALHGRRVSRRLVARACNQEVRLLTKSDFCFLHIAVQITT